MDASQLAMVLSKLPKNAPGANLHSDRETIAEQHGGSERTLKYADKVREHAAAPVIKAVEERKVAVSNAAAIAELPKHAPAAALKNVETGGTKTLRQAVKPVEAAALEDEVGNSREIW